MFQYELCYDIIFFDKFIPYVLKYSTYVKKQSFKVFYFILGKVINQLRKNESQ